MDYLVVFLAACFVASYATIGAGSFLERVIFWRSRRHRAMLQQFGAELDSLAD